MTIWSGITGCRWPGAALMMMSWLLVPSGTAVALESTPDSTITSIDAGTVDRQFAAYHTSPPLPAWRSSPYGPEKAVQGHVAEARRVLLELQAFVEKAARMVELGDRLRRQRRENDRLRRSLSSSEAAKSAFEDHAIPMDVARSALTASIVRSWLKSIRLKDRSNDVDRDLLASEKFRLALESRAATLKRTLIERRTEMMVLQARRTALDMELGHARQSIAEAHDDMHRAERQRADITAAITALRRQVTSTLRAVLLEKGTDETR